MYSVVVVVPQWCFLHVITSAATIHAITTTTTTATATAVAFIVTLHFRLPKYDQCLLVVVRLIQWRLWVRQGASTCVQILIITVYRTVDSP